MSSPDKLMRFSPKAKLNQASLKAADSTSAAPESAQNLYPRCKAASHVRVPTRLGQAMFLAQCECERKRGALGSAGNCHGNDCARAFIKNVVA
jgi:hypothetical protein